MALKRVSQITLKTDTGVNDKPIIAPNLPKEA